MVRSPRVRVNRKPASLRSQALAPIDHEGDQMIDARSLHGWLGNKRAFAHWIKNRVEEYGFFEGEDFMSLTTKTGGRPRTDYLLTLDMAKGKIAEYGFEAGEDYSPVSVKTGGRPRTD